MGILIVILVAVFSSSKELEALALEGSMHYRPGWACAGRGHSRGKAPIAEDEIKFLLPIAKIYIA